jgi:hypothetical protein
VTASEEDMMIEIVEKKINSEGLITTIRGMMTEIERKKTETGGMTTRIVTKEDSATNHRRAIMLTSIVN